MALIIVWTLPVRLPALAMHQRLHLNRAGALHTQKPIRSVYIEHYYTLLAEDATSE